MKLASVLIAIWLSVGCLACEILVKAVDATNPDAEKDRRGCYKRGMPVVVMPDGWPWGSEERLPRFVVIKIPTITPDRALKYIAQQYNGSDLFRRRLWQIRWADLPASARTRLQTTGQLTIKAGTYTGTSDYTWAQIRQYFRNLETGLDETEDL